MAVFQFLFPLFLNNEETQKARSVVSLPFSEPVNEVFRPDGSPDPRYVYVLPNRPRRFAGDYSLGRGHYYVVAKNAAGYDDGTLLSELSAYIRDDLPHPIYLVDLCMEENGYFPPQPAMFLILGPREHVPAEINKILDAAEPSKHLVEVHGPSGLSHAVRIPYKVQSLTIDNVVDLRLPETQRWFWKAFGVERLHCFSFVPRMDNAALTDRMRATHKEQFRSPEDFLYMLPGLLGQGLGDENGVTQAIGTWLRVNGAAGLVFPSARMDCACLIWDGQFSDFIGWNFVDYRESPPPTLANVLLPVGDWPGFDGYPKVGIVTPPQNRNLGSWRVKGLQEWQTRERDMTISVRPAGGNSAAIAHRGETNVTSLTNKEVPARQHSKLPPYSATQQSLSAPPIQEIEKYKVGPDWFRFKPGDRWLHILCPSCRWGDIWDRGEEEPPDRCPRCGFTKSAP